MSECSTDLGPEVSSFGSIRTRFVTAPAGRCTHSHFSRVFRAACVGTASPSDECLLVENIKTLVDLRSEQELSGDIMKYNSTVFDSYGSLTYDVQMSKTSGRPKAMLLRKDDQEPQRCALPLCFPKPRFFRPL
jgi:hypothetical protein